MSDGIALSVVIPAYDEAMSVRALVDECAAALTAMACPAWEIILVDDGSTDATAEVMRDVAHERDGVKAILLRSHFGKAAALMAGFHEARGDVVITMDADLQDDPAELPRFVAMIDGGFDLVSGWKKERHDSTERRVLSRIFNFVVGRTLGVALHDANCGFKAYRRWCVKELEIRGNQHRFIPAILERRGARVGEIEVRHRPRAFGSSKYGPARYAQGAVDLATILLLTRFAQQPLYFFALIGMPLLLLGVLIGVYFIANHLLHLLAPPMGFALTLRPLLIAAVVCFLAGLQIFLIGLLAELILQTSRIERSYGVREIVARDAQSAAEPLTEMSGVRAATPAPQPAVLASVDRTP